VRRTDEITQRYAGRRRGDRAETRLRGYKIHRGALRPSSRSGYMDNVSKRTTEGNEILENKTGRVVKRDATQKPRRSI